MACSLQSQCNLKAHLTFKYLLRYDARLLIVKAGIMNNTLKKFRCHCQCWHQTQTLYNYRGRANIYRRLTSRFGVEAVKRHRKTIRTILDNAEGLCTLNW